MQLARIDKDSGDDTYLVNFFDFWNRLVQAETQLHSQERDAAGICLPGNAHKTEYMCLNQTGDISTLGGSSVSSTEKDIDTRLAKAWTAIGHMKVGSDW